ncbi:MAG: NUDIX domain-containing protein [Mycobacteriales bacterium]
MSREVRAAGGVLWRRVHDQVQVALVHRPKYDDWSLPKGKLDPGELPVVAALREVCEETGFGAVAGRTLGTSRYRVLDRGRDVQKTVRWWAMRATEGTFLAGAEVDLLRWLPLPAALARASSGYDCAPLRAFAAGPADTTSVLLVRHGSAGDRASWAGDDDHRPLDEAGVAQAAAVAAMLPVYAPTRVLSAPVVRCIQTVRPLADRLGLAVEPVEAAREPEQHPAGELTRLLWELAAGGRPAVVCSQGGAIPEAVRALSGLPEVRAHKGSVWALSFAGGRLVDADYTARLVG